MVSPAVRAAAQRIRLVLTDVDGVLTDAGVYYSAEGEQLKRFSVRDGMGVERLRLAGIETGIITGENSEPVMRRAEKLSINELHLGIKDKPATLRAILSRRDIADDAVAYIGDDVNDLQVIKSLRERGLTGAPSDAIDDVRSVVHFISPAAGGHGAFRAFADWILKLRAES